MINAGVADSVDKVNSSVAGPNGQAKSCRLRRGAGRPAEKRRSRRHPVHPVHLGRSREGGRGGARGLARVDKDSHPGWHEL
jgi:hypothetical protein